MTMWHYMKVKVIRKCISADCNEPLARALISDWTRKAREAKPGKAFGCKKKGLETGDAVCLIVLRVNVELTVKITVKWE